MVRSSKMNPYTSVAAIADHLPRLWGINRARRWPILCVFCKGWDSRNHELIFHSVPQQESDSL
jgi:hypothetical protein